jgi:hypothetical protein
LGEFVDIVNDTISRIEKSGRIKSPLHKEVLKFESTALIFWLFRVSKIFPEPLHKLTLDEMHDQYYARLKKHGYDRDAVQAVCDDLNSRYRTYDKFTDSADDFVKVGTNFAKFVSERSKTDLDVMEITIPMKLIERTTAKLKEFREAMKI